MHSYVWHVSKCALADVFCCTYRCRVLLHIEMSWSVAPTHVHNAVPLIHVCDTALHESCALHHSCIHMCGAVGHRYVCDTVLHDVFTGRVDKMPDCSLRDPTHGDVEGNSW